MNIDIPFHDVPVTEIIDAKDGRRLIPVGWGNLFEEIWWMKSGYSKESLQLTFRIEKGLLRFEMDSEWTTNLDRKLIQRVCQSVASSSAKICMECGKHGFRRKNEQGQPCLCSNHYIEFANQLSAFEGK